MKKILFFLSIVAAHSISAQSTLPVINATSSQVAINDDGYLDKNAWSLSPKARPDIYTADRTRKTKWVTFYTDIDSIKIKVKPGKKYDFIILLNGKDSCFTRITSAIPPANTSNANFTKNDTIPFTLTSFDAIQVKATVNDSDTLNLHFDASSFDFRFTKDAILKKTKLLSNQPDALSGKVNPDYRRLNKVFKLQIGNITWTDPEVASTSFTAHDMDGRFGWNLFEGKEVEIDYDHSLLIIHSSKRERLHGYVKSKLRFIRSFPCVRGTFDIDGKRYNGDFILDNGSDQAIILDSAWVEKQNFPKDLKLIKSSTIKDPRGVTYETRTVLSPLLNINSFTLTDIPTLVLSNKNPVGFEVNYLGNGLLKRFNIILDFKNDYIYMKPNHLMKVKYKEKS